MKTSSLALLASIATLSFVAGTAQAAPKVVASIKPVHSLVASIMAGVGEPDLIVQGAASPHTYSLKPSNARALEQADVIVWVGHGLEAFLDKPLQALGSKAKIVELEDAPGLELLAFREGGAFEAHDHGEHAGHDHAGDAEAAGHDESGHQHSEEEHAKGEHAEGEHAGHEDHDHGTHDLHVWLNPMNAKAMASAIEAALVEADPDNAETYKTNTAALLVSLDQLDKELAEQVAPIKDKPFVVFHDAYQYFEHRYDVRVAGSITVSPETMPGADRVSQMHAKIRELGAACVFAEPQFEPRLVNVVIEGTEAKSGTLDPEGANLPEGPDFYPQLMRNIASSLRDCLGT